MEKSFDDCTISFLEKSFGLRQVLKHESLTYWLDLAKNEKIGTEFIIYDA